MDKLIFRFYGIAILLTLILIASIFGVFRHFDKSLEEQVESVLKARSEAILAKINSEINQRVQIVEDVSSYVKVNPDSQELLTYLETILKDNDGLSSIYYGTAENTMINGSGWVLPEGFDLRTRPWYEKAVEEGNTAITDVFLNASKDKWVITIAKPIFRMDSTLAGVVGADISIEKKVEIVEKMSNEKEQYLLIDSQRNIIASPYGVDGLVTLSELSPDMAKDFTRENNEIFLSTLDGREGYVLFNKIGNTNLTLGSFIPKDVYASYQKRWVYSMLFAASLILLIFIGTLLMQRKAVLKPLLNLAKDIEEIPLIQNPAYRIHDSIEDPCSVLRQSINRVLAELERHFTDLEESQSLLIKSEERNRAIISALPDIIFQYDDKGNFLSCKTNQDSILLIPKESIVGKNICEVMPEEIAQLGMKNMQKALSTNEIVRFEYQLDIDGETRYFEARAVKCAENEVLNIVRDITFEKKEKDYILEVSYKDHLTGLFNRRYFEEELEKMDNQESLPLLLIILDVNGLKLTNDAFGHLAGDDLLKKLASVLQHVCPDNGFAARIGGDEFVLLCPNSDHATADEITAKINHEINCEKINNMRISVSAGWELRCTLEQTMRDTFIRAENHMFKKKIVESKSMRNQTIKVIMQTLNEKNEREKRHSVEVSEWSRKIGAAMNLNEQMLNEIETAGLLHDIGKIAIREDVLNKPGVLSASEFDEIKKHSESGYQILKSVDSYSSLAEYVLSHHERFDGKGYPRGLRGEEIPLIARIICVADAFEAMLADRPYRKGMSRDEAINEIKRNSGTQFDPVVVESLLSLF